ncbi:MAG: hypothetical protein ACREPN_09215 [Rudaea sp.]
MFARLRRHLRAFLNARSGTRFRAHHRRVKARPHVVRTTLMIAAGIVLILLGVVLLFLPGPGLLIGALGALLIAGESLIVARLLDRADFWAVRWFRRWRK